MKQFPMTLRFAVGILLLAACSLKTHAGTLYGVAYTGGAEQLVSIDPVTGASTPITALASGAVGVVQGVSAYNPADSLFSIYLSTGTSDFLYTVNTQTGTVTNHPAVSNPAGALAYDPGTGTLYGVAYTGGAEQLVSIDPVTGASTPITALASGAVGVLQGVSAYDPADSLFSIYLSTGTSDFLYTVNAQTGTVTNHPVVTNPAGALAYDPGTGTLYGVVYTGGAEQLVSVDPVTGASTPIGVLVPGAVGLGVSAYNPADSLFSIYLSTGTSDFLYTVNTQTGTVVYDPVVSNTAGALAYGETRNRQALCWPEWHYLELPLQSEFAGSEAPSVMDEVSKTDNTFEEL